MIEISFDKVGKFFGKNEAIRSISFKIEQHCVYCLIGPNGSGKTTALRILVGLTRPSKGKIHFSEDSADIGLVDFLKHAGVVLDPPSFRKGLRGKDLLKMTAAVRNVINFDERLEELVNQFEMQNFVEKNIESYSRGMLQRILISNAILSKPEVLIFDEPMSGLDLRSQLIVRNFINELKKSSEYTVILTSHDIWETDILCDKVMFFLDGTTNSNWIDTDKKEFVYASFPSNNINKFQFDGPYQTYFYDGNNLIVFPKEKFKEMFENNIYDLSFYRTGSKVIKDYLEQMKVYTKDER